MTTISLFKSGDFDVVFFDAAIAPGLFAVAVISHCEWTENKELKQKNVEIRGVFTFILIDSNIRDCMSMCEWLFWREWIDCVVPVGKRICIVRWMSFGTRRNEALTLYVISVFEKQVK